MVSRQRVANIYFECYLNAILNFFSKLKSDSMTTLEHFLFSK